MIGKWFYISLMNIWKQQCVFPCVCVCVSYAYLYFKWVICKDEPEEDDGGDADEDLEPRGVQVLLNNNAETIITHDDDTM